MKNNYILGALLALLLVTVPAQAKFHDIKITGYISCDDLDTDAELKFIKGAPNGTYSSSIDTSEEYAPYVSIDGTPLMDAPFVKPFKIPNNESGLDFSVSVDPSLFDELGTSFSSFNIPIFITPGDDTTLFTGFGETSGSVEVNDSGCSNTTTDDEDPEVADSIEDTLVGADDPSFEDVNTNLLITNEVDLVVNFTYKVDKTAYDLFTTFNNLEEGDLTERAKELAAKFGIKLDIKNLKKLARNELKQAAKGKKGEAKSAAVEEAKGAGINKLLSEIILKLPELPAKGSATSAEDREAIKKIRKAKKAKILEGLEVELVSTTDSTMDGKAVKCLSFKITLPAKICAKDDGSKTLVIGGQNIMNLEVGETVTIDIPVKVTGVFKQFFGDSGKKGKNGKITIPLTLTNPASE